MTDFQAMIRWQRKTLWFSIAFSYVTQAICAVAGTLCLWCAIDFFLTGQFFLSAVFTAISFWNCRNFITDAETRADARHLLTKLREVERTFS
jgi:hypothetical protein